MARDAFGHGGRKPPAALAGFAACMVGAALIASSPGTARAPQGDDPVSLVRAYFAAASPQERATLAARLAAHRDYRPSRLSAWLHRAAAFPELKTGPQTITVDVGGGEQRSVFLIVPEGYRPDRAWPLIYALHPSGRSPAEWASQLQTLVGSLGGAYLIASPEFRQNHLSARPPFAPEHPAILDAVARQLHVAADRVYPFGYSMGGWAAWHLALFYPDRVAGAISMAAGFDVTPADDGLWELVVPNVRSVDVLNIWGDSDPGTVRGLDGQPLRTYAESNRWFQERVRRFGLPVVNLELTGGHNDLVPPLEPVQDILSARRPADPRRITHTFRHLHQASCYWLEGLSWTGDAWGEERPAPLPARKGETETQTLARTLGESLAQLTGRIDGQTIRVTRRHIGDLVVWLGDRTIDWNRPVTLEVDGRVAFTGRVTRDAGVALARAAATMDFEALRFAGLRVRADGRVEVVTAATVPDPVWRLAMRNLPPVQR